MAKVEQPKITKIRVRPGGAPRPVVVICPAGCRILMTLG
jgi:hypothetical protein